MQIKCQKCGFENQMGCIFCRKCGVKINMDDFDPNKLESMNAKEKVKKKFKALLKTIGSFCIVCALLGLLTALFLPFGHPEYTAPSKEITDEAMKKWESVKEGQTATFSMDELSAVFEQIGTTPPPKEGEEEKPKTRGHYLPEKNPNDLTGYHVKHIVFSVEKELVRIRLYTSLYGFIPAIFELTGKVGLTGSNEHRKLEFKGKTAKMGHIPMPYLETFFADKFAFLTEIPEAMKAAAKTKELEWKEKEVEFEGTVAPKKKKSKGKGRK